MVRKEEGAVGCSPLFLDQNRRLHGRGAEILRFAQFLPLVVLY